MSGCSYSEILTRPSSLRKPLVCAPTMTKTGTTKATAASSRLQRSPWPLSSTESSVVNSPRRLLSYYLSKAEYNALDGEKNDKEVDVSITSDAAEEVLRAEADRALHYSSSHSAEVVDARCDGSMSALARPPLYNKAFPSSGAAEAARLPQGPRRAAPSSSRNESPPALQGRALVTDGGVTASTSATIDELPTLAKTPALDRESSSASQLTPAPPSSALTHLAVYSEEQRRLFEQQVMEEVEGILQAQRCESNAELEAYKLAAEEARATLRVVEAALEQQLRNESRPVRVNGDQSTSDRTSEDNSSSVSKVMKSVHANLGNGDGLPQRAVPTLSSEMLTSDLSRVALAAAPLAAQQLLDIIMGIEDGQDVPAVLLRAVQHLFQEFSSEIVPVVMQMAERPNHLPPKYGTSVSEDARVAGKIELDVRLQHARAEAAAREEEVNALRRVLRSFRGTQDIRHSPSASLPMTSPILLPATQLHPSQESLVHSLRDRFFAECHAMLTRSREEALSLRRALEAERRQHFLTRLHLLKSGQSHAQHAEARPPPSLGRGGLAGSSRRATSKTPVPPREDSRSPPDTRSGGSSSPVVRGSTATRSPPSPTCSSTDAKGRPPGGDATRPQVLEGGTDIVSDVDDDGGDIRGLPGVTSVVPSPHNASRSMQWEEGDAKDALAVQTADDEGHPCLSSFIAQSTPYHSLPSGRGPRPAVASLQTALRVAEEVLRTTSSAACAADNPNHPYYGAFTHSPSGPTASAPRSVADAGTLRERRSNGESPWCGSGRRRAEDTRREHSLSFADSTHRFATSSNGGATSPSTENKMDPWRASPPSRSSARWHGSSPFCADDSAASFATEGKVLSRYEAPSTSTLSTSSPNETYERRVWDKTVELLSRYALPQQRGGSRG